MSFLAVTANELAESGLVPDAVIRSGIRRLCAARRDEISGQNGQDLESFVNKAAFQSNTISKELNDMFIVIKCGHCP